MEAEGQEAFAKVVAFQACPRLHRFGLLDQVEELLARSEVFAPPDLVLSHLLNQQGLLYRIRGDLDRAEGMLNRSLKIYQCLGRAEGIAGQYGNLGLLYQTRGDLDRAEELLHRSIEIEEGLQGLDGLASSYASLGLVARDRGDVDQARAHWLRSLAFFEQLRARNKIEGVERWLAELDAPTSRE